MTKPLLILQLRPENETSDSEFAAILKYGELQQQDVERFRIEMKGLPEGVDPFLDDDGIGDVYGIIVGLYTVYALVYRNVISTVS